MILGDAEPLQEPDEVLVRNERQNFSLAALYMGQPAPILISMFMISIRVAAYSQT